MQRPLVNLMTQWGQDLVAQGYFTDDFMFPLMQGEGFSLQWPENEWGPHNDPRSESRSFVWRDTGASF